MLSRAALLRSHSAPPELIEADLVDQLADASEELALLRSGRPEGPDLAWSRHYALVQNTYNRVLDHLTRLRKTFTELPAPPEPAETPEPTKPLPAPQPEAAPSSPPARNPASSYLAISASPRPTPRNRHERRRLEALSKQSTARHKTASGPIPRPANTIRPNPSDPSNPNPPGLVHTHTMKGWPGVGTGQTMPSEGSGR